MSSGLVRQSFEVPDRQEMCTVQIEMINDLLDPFCIAYMAFEAQLGVTVALEVIQMYN